MRKRRDRRRPHATSDYPFEDLRHSARERRKLKDRRLENLDAEQRQLLLSEMPGHPASGRDRKD